MSSSPRGDKSIAGRSFTQFSIDRDYFLYKVIVFVPQDGDFRAQILKESHHSPLVQGIQKFMKPMYQLNDNSIGPKCYVKECVLKCPKCEVNKQEQLAGGDFLCPLDIPNAKWESIYMNSIVGVPKRN